MELKCDKNGNLIVPATSELYAVMVEGASAPSVFHQDYESAEKEAKRLTIKTKNNSYVLRAISKIQLNDVIVTKF